MNNLFFNNEYVLIVDDRPEAVKEGVQELIQGNIPADMIRRKTLEKIQSHDGY
jgi:hypothetical protein